MARRKDRVPGRLVAAEGEVALPLSWLRHVARFARADGLAPRFALDHVRLWGAVGGAGMDGAEHGSLVIEATDGRALVNVRLALPAQAGQFQKFGDLFLPAEAIRRAAVAGGFVVLRTDGPAAVWRGGPFGDDVPCSRPAHRDGRPYSWPDTAAILATRNVTSADAYLDGPRVAAIVAGINAVVGKHREPTAILMRAGRAGTPSRFEVRTRIAALEHVLAWVTAFLMPVSRQDWALPESAPDEEVA